MIIGEGREKGLYTELFAVTNLHEPNPKLLDRQFSTKKNQRRFIVARLEPQTFEGIGNSGQQCRKYIFIQF